jgi:hypothetical protein
MSYYDYLDTDLNLIFLNLGLALYLIIVVLNEPSLGSSLCLSVIVKVASNLTERGICSHGKNVQISHHS